MEYTKSQIKLNFYRFKKYKEPFEHLVAEEFLDERTIRHLTENLPKSKFNFDQYLHYGENKSGLSKINLMHKSYKEVVKQMQGDDFVEKLEHLTGLEGLIPDPNLNGGGIHVSKNGGFLKMHTDFNTHYKFKGYKRVLNLILFLNPNWGSSNKGELILSNGRKSKKIAPLLNRVVLFRTDDTTLHGHPDPFRSFNGESRVSLALYYYQKEELFTQLKSTRYIGNTVFDRFFLCIENTMLKIRLRLLVWINK